MQGNEPEVILAVFPLLAAATIGAVGAGIGAYGKYRAAKANKPIKERAFRQRANTGYLKRYMADLRGRSANRARTELAMRPALRAIGAQQRQGQRMLAYQSAQQGLEGSGIAAQKQLSLQQGTTQAVAGVGEKILNQQLAQARQMQAAKEGQRMKLAGEISRQEGAISEANRLSTFQAAETNRQRQQQYDQSVAAAKGNIGLSMLGGALQGAAPGLISEAGKLGGVPEVDAAMDILQTTGVSPRTTASISPLTSADLTANMMQQKRQSLGMGIGNTSNLAYTSPYQRQPQTNFAYAKSYQGGGLVGATREDVYSVVPGIKKRYQELERTREQEIKDFEIAEAERLKKHEEQAKLFKTGESRRDVIDYQKDTTKTLKKKGIVGEGGEEIYGTKGLKGENVAGALQYLKTDPEEYNVLKEKADVLKKYSLGEKQLAKAKTQYETVKDNFVSFEDYLSQVTSDPETDIERLFGENLSKREKKKLSKKYDKKTTALLNAQGLQVEEGKYEEPLKTRDPGEFKPGVAPQGISQKEVEKIEREELTKLHKAGVDLSANIAKAKTNREAVNFYKNVGNMTTDQIWSDPFAIANPAKVATMIATQKKAQQKTQLAVQTKADKLIADQQKVTNNIESLLLDMGQTTAARREDDLDTPDVDEGLIKGEEYGEQLRQMVINNPKGDTPSQRQEMLKLVDLIMGKEDPNATPISEEVDLDDPKSLTAAVMEELGKKLDPTSKIAKLLKELLKRPLLPVEGTLDEKLLTDTKTTQPSSKKQTFKEAGFNW